MILALKVKTQSISDNEKNLFKESATRSFSLTNELKVIGLYNPEKGYKYFVNESNEKELLEDFWAYINGFNNLTLVGFWCKTFDIPLLYQRTFINKIELANFKFPLPEELGNYKADKAINKFKDLACIWNCGNYKSFDTLYNVALAFNLFYDDNERKFYCKEDEQKELFWQRWMEMFSTTNPAANPSKQFLNLQLSLIYKLSNFLL